MTKNSIAFVAHDVIPPSPPPSASVGAIGWMRKNLFANITDTIMTLVGIYVIYSILVGVLPWLVFNSTWNAGSLKECRELGSGACLAVINTRFNQLMYGFYPSEEYWRVNLSFILLFVAVAPVLFAGLPRKMLWFSVAYPIIAYFLIWGGVFGLAEIGSDQLGGFLLTMIIGVTGIVASLPIGILLALGRQSDLFILKAICVGFIEFIRGVPLITLLFVASTLLTYFLPPGTKFDLVLRVLIMVTLFASAYMAEVIRGGLAALPKGQYEAADALGLDYWKSMRLIILPQALKISIPSIVNTFIGLFKDTTLVSVIGLLDPLGFSNTIRADQNWNGIVWELYGFIALLFFIFCFSMSRYSNYLENKLQTGHR